MIPTHTGSLPLHELQLKMAMHIAAHLSSGAVHIGSRMIHEDTYPANTIPRAFPHLLAELFPKNTAKFPWSVLFSSLGRARSLCSSCLEHFSRKSKHESTQAKGMPGSHCLSEPPYRSLNTYTIDFYPFLPISLHRLTTTLELCNWWHGNRSNSGMAENNQQKWKWYLSNVQLSCQLSWGTYLFWESESTAEWWPLEVLKVNFGKKRKKKKNQKIVTECLGWQHLRLKSGNCTELK